MVVQIQASPSYSSCPWAKPLNLNCQMNAIAIWSEEWKFMKYMRSCLETCSKLGTSEGSCFPNMHKSGPKCALSWKLLLMQWHWSKTWKCEDRWTFKTYISLFSVILQGLMDYWECVCYCMGCVIALKQGPEIPDVDMRHRGPLNHLNGSAFLPCLLALI